MLDIQAGRVDGSQTQLGEGRTRPWVGLPRGDGGDTLKAARRAQAWPKGSSGAGGIQANPPSSPAWAGYVYPQHRLQEAPYQHGCPMSSAPFPLKAETCVSMTLLRSQQERGGEPPTPTPLPRHRVSAAARPWPRASPAATAAVSTVFRAAPVGQDSPEFCALETCWPGLSLSKGHPPDHLLPTNGARLLPAVAPSTPGHRKQRTTWLACLCGTYGDPQSSERTGFSYEMF